MNRLLAKLFRTFKSKIMLLSFSLILLPLIFYTAFMANTMTRQYLDKEAQFQESYSDQFVDRFGYAYLTYLSMQEVKLSNTRRTLAYLATQFKSLITLPEVTSNPSLMATVTERAFTSIGKKTLFGLYYSPDHPERTLTFDPRCKYLLDSESLTGVTYNRFLAHTILPKEGYYNYLYHQDSNTSYIAHSLPVGDEENNEVVIFARDITSLEHNYDNELAPMLMFFRRILNDSVLGPNRDLLLVDDAGHVLLHRNHDYDMTGKIPTKLLSRAAANGQIHDRLQTDQGSFQVNATFFKPLNLYVLLLSDEKDLHSALLFLLSRILLIAGAIMLISLIVAYVVVNQTTTPLKRIANTALSIKNIDLSHEDSLKIVDNMLPVERHDEIGDVAEALRSMSGALHQSINDLMTKTAKQKRMEGELNAARDIQLGMLSNPPLGQKLAPYGVKARMIPAKEVGGDLYDIIPLGEGKVLLALGDVSDKGVPAALFMAMAITLIRETAAMRLYPAQAVTEINRRLCEHNPNMMFVTLFIGIFDTQRRILTYANGGHCQPLIFGKNHLRALEELSGPLVGAMEDVEYTEFTTAFEPDEGLLIYTDGVTEAQNGNKEMYGWQRLTDFFERRFGQNYAAEEVLEALYRDVEDFCGSVAEASDDITALIISPTPPDGAQKPA